MHDKTNGHVDNEESEVLELFRRMNPVPPDQVSEDAELSPEAERLLHQITAGNHPVPRLLPTRKQRHQRRMLPFSAVTVVLATAAFAWVLARQASDPLQVACYPEVDLEGDIFVLPKDERGFVEICADAYEQGMLGQPEPSSGLSACVLESGVVGVFPNDGGDPCGRLGLAPLADEPAPGEQEVGSLAEEITRPFLDQDCVSPADARRVVADELAERGFDDWQILDPGPYTEERPCASLAIEPVIKTITLVPIDPIPPQSER